MSQSELLWRQPQNNPWTFTSPLTTDYRCLLGLQSASCSKQKRDRKMQDAGPHLPPPIARSSQVEVKIRFPWPRQGLQLFQECNFVPSTLHVSPTSPSIGDLPHHSPKTREVSCCARGSVFLQGRAMLQHNERFYKSGKLASHFSQRRLCFMIAHVSAFARNVAQFWRLTPCEMVWGNSFHATRVWQVRNRQR